MDARFRFYYEMHEKILKTADGMVDFTHIGEDLGTQTAQLFDFEIFEKHFAPKYQKYFEMVHSYGARTMMHMCGCVRAFLPRLIELGLDVYDVVQPTTPEMDIAVLKNDFGENSPFAEVFAFRLQLHLEAWMMWLRRWSGGKDFFQKADFSLDLPMLFR